MPGSLMVSGWGQPHDALRTIAPLAATVDFARHASAQAALLDIAAHGKQKDVLIGWSLGGQLLVRAIAAKLLRPRALVLIATPFQFVATPERALGMPADLYGKFRENYAKDPARTLNMAWETILRGDERPDIVRAHLNSHDKTALLGKDWLHWLDVLQDFHCDGLYLADFPPTLLIHGDKDGVVFHEQSQCFAAAMPHARLLTLSGCGHAPHWHDEQAVQQAIDAFTQEYLHGG